jgi:G3E family GTPase
MGMQRLAFTVIGGFLGAGKTTLLNHWLRHAGGQRLAVLVNDFGALNIDADLIADHGGDTIALTNGCVCCQIGDDLSMALIGVLQQRGRFDAVVVEASGVSDPWRIAQLGLADPALALDGVIVAVDAGALLCQAADPLLADTLPRQVARADLVIINKTDLADAPTLERVHGWMAGHAPSAQRCEAHEARVPVELLSGAALLRGAREAAWGAGMPRHAHGLQFDTWACQPAGVLSGPGLQAWLEAMPPGVLRLKGVVQTGPGQWSELQFAGRSGRLRAAPAPQGGPAIVAIGLAGKLPVRALEACVQEARAVRAGGRRA